MHSSQFNWKFALTAIYVRLRFVLLVAGLGALFAVWPWLTARWDRWLANWSKTDLETSVSGGSEYFCPMDPGVVSAWPAICPICNMDLIRRSKGDAQIMPDGALARMQFTPYKLTLAGVRTFPVQATEQSSGVSASNDQDKKETAKLRVPVSSIVYWDRQAVVYVESMPGMFDAIPVTLLERDGSEQTVQAKLSPGQRVAAHGALLLDAEARLRPNMSTQYFGAAQQSALAVAPPEPPKKTSAAAKRGLSTDEQALVDRQQVCPVTQAALGSMGTPVFEVVEGRKIALCCAGCRGRLKASPEKYAKWLDERQSSGSR